MHLSKSLEASTTVNGTAAGMQSKWKQTFYPKVWVLIYPEAYKGSQVIAPATLSKVP